MNDFKKTNLEIIDRYNKRFKIYGDDPLSLNWKDQKAQHERFSNFLKLANVENKNILDVGCGFADLYTYLRNKNKLPKKYTGIDINPDFINHCKKKFPSLQFHVGNLIDNHTTDEKFDIVLMVGVLSYNFKEFDNIKFTKEVVTNAFNFTNDTLIFDMQSTVVNKNYETAEHIHYQKPGDILDFALSLTPNVVLKHDNIPNPAREFIVLMKREI